MLIAATALFCQCRNTLFLHQCFAIIEYQLIFKSCFLSWNAPTNQNIEIFNLVFFQNCNQQQINNLLTIHQGAMIFDFFGISLRPVRFFRVLSKLRGMAIYGTLEVVLKPPTEPPQGVKKDFEVFRFLFSFLYINLCALGST